MNNIANKVVVITGASSGLGEATARHLASLGAMVMLGARRQDRLEAIANDIRTAGGKAEVLATDVAQADQVQMLVDKAIETFGRLDVMINNAGLMSVAPIAEVKVDEWDRMIDINIKGVLYGIAAALPVFTKQNSGHFINLASVAAHKVSPGTAVYSGTKFAVKAITEGLRAEVGGNIRTTLLSPGLIDSELKFGSSDEATSQFVQNIYKDAIPALSIAKAVAYAIEQPDDVDINEIIIRPTIQDF
ncbi:SDR family oxidoreductase [Granulosicoccus antarcticus]|uniref:Putative oxidoreductase n=1 Tax=Granulosicoccus antarcticus IMCC3135 TaxID=1192854 RepID=A0A2Z2NXC1_9GAMM|nr:SDR family oxidoreductase [Granulosicoccus antarcticus]ASJ73480.1 putative oxidoreductase [Granulosicoccus antarcticus IMCC3135]